jgi:hypothetical protein
MKDPLAFIDNLKDLPAPFIPKKGVTGVTGVTTAHPQHKTAKPAPSVPVTPPQNRGVTGVTTRGPLGVVTPVTPPQNPGVTEKARTNSADNRHSAVGVTPVTCHT